MEKVSYSNNGLATQYLTKEDIRKVAPKVFCKTATNPNLTDRYGYVGTEQVIDDLASHGWFPVEAKQQKMRKESSIRSFHSVSFQNPNVCISRTDYVDADGRNYAFSRVDDFVLTYVSDQPSIDSNGNILGYIGKTESGAELNVTDREMLHVEDNGTIHLYIGYDRYGHSFQVRKTENVECYPRIILTNSYDGFNAFTFRVGLFRLVCSNGLVVCTDTFVDIKIRHTKYNVTALEGVLANAICAVDSQIGTFNDMRTVTLKPEEKVALAINALRYRKGLEDDAPMVADEEGIKDLLDPVRDEDKEDTLWAVFNILQEKITKGGAVVGINGKKARKMRGIKSFSKDIDINQRLYKAALAYLPAPDNAPAEVA